MPIFARHLITIWIAVSIGVTGSSCFADISLAGHGIEGERCAAILRGAEVPTELGRSATLPSFFRSSWRNRISLKNHSEQIVELNDVFVREQCYGTCYLYSATGHIESYLKAQGSLGPGDYLTTLPTVMTLARMRMRGENQKKVENPQSFRELVDLGSEKDILKAGSAGGFFFLDRQSLDKVGGPEAIIKIEEKVRRRLAGISFWRPSGDRSVFLDLLNLDQSELNDQVVTAYEAALSEAAREPIKLRFIRIVYYKADYLSDIKRISEALASGQAPYVALKKLFGSSDSKHAVQIVGVSVDAQTNQVLGYKFLNPWGSFFGADGFGYISLSQVSQFLDGFYFISDIRVTN